MRDSLSLRGSALVALLLISAGTAAAGCSSSSNNGTPTTPCGGILVDRFKELTIVDDGVVADARSSNNADGAWSFRNVVENMAPTGTDPGNFVLSWFTEWRALVQVNGFNLNESIAPQRDQMDPLIVCPWAERTASNKCTADCTNVDWQSTCTVQPPKLDLAVAPFKLLAIVNRMDLRGQPQISKYGEARLVFGLTNGSADDPSSPMMPMTLIFEFDLPTTTPSVEDWAN